MSKTFQPLEKLAHFMPNGAFPLVIPFFDQYPIHLSIKRERKSIYGNYRPPRAHEKKHIITINGNLNEQHFLLTLLHEIAHLIVVVTIPKRVAPHGKEWKIIFSKILEPFINQRIFDDNLIPALKKYCQNPGASSCSDPDLLLALSQFDEHSENVIFVKDLQPNQFFYFSNKKYKMIEKRRTRYTCEEITTKRLLLFHFATPIQLVLED